MRLSPDRFLIDYHPKNRAIPGAQNRDQTAGVFNILATPQVPLTWEHDKNANRRNEKTAFSLRVTPIGCFEHLGA
ncbi:hypothetical protein CCP3SC15_100033 [Gammaproteobacteria bacterium]